MRPTELQCFTNPKNDGLHDAHVVSIKVIPAKSRRSKSKVELILALHGYGKNIHLEFIDCMNIFSSIDFDLPDCGTCVIADLSVVQTKPSIEGQLINAKNHWTTTFLDEPLKHEGPTFSFSTEPCPLPNRLQTAMGYNLYKIRMLSGILSIIAKTYKLSLKSKPKS
jgi:hypothetical protein